MLHSHAIVALDVMKLLYLLLSCFILAMVSCQKGTDPEPKPEVWTFTTFAGSGLGNKDGDLSSAKFNYPTDLVMMANGDILVTDYGNSAIRKISNGIVTTVAGIGKSGNLDGPVSSASLDEPYGIAVISDGTIYYADRGLSKIRKISDGQVISVAGGSGLKDGTGSDAGFSAPCGLLLAKDQNLYIADSYTNSIRRMTLQGVVTTYAGALPSSSLQISYKDGLVLEARFSQPTGICQGSDGSFYITDQQNGMIRKISPNGQVTTLATGLIFPSGITVAADGTIYFTHSNALCKITTDGKVKTLYGSTLASAVLFTPSGLIVAPDGSIYICDSNNNRIARGTKE